MNVIIFIALTFFFTAAAVQCAEDEQGSASDVNDKPTKGKKSKAAIADEIYDQFLEALERKKR